MMMMVGAESSHDLRSVFLCRDLFHSGQASSPMPSKIMAVVVFKGMSCLH